MNNNKKPLLITGAFYTFNLKLYIMKKIVTLLVLFISTFTFAQMSVDKINVDTVAVNQMKIGAEKWFKNEYVKHYFKDPYSYKLMGIKAIPITFSEGLNIQLSKVLSTLDKCRVHPDDRSQTAHDLCVTKYKENLAMIDKEQEYIDAKVDVDYHTKKKAIAVKFAKIYLEKAESIALYLTDLSEKNRLENAINNLTPDQSNSIGYYDIRLDCYSKNSLGNEVLGRFSFPFTLKEPLYGEATAQYVLNLNN